MLVLQTRPQGTAHTGLSSTVGNLTDHAHMVLAMIECALQHPRPDDCIACMSNWDKLARAREALTTMVGRC